MPQFSILMANYNNANFIDEAIQSVLDQTFEDWELVIVDDASRDDSVDRISVYLPPEVALGLLEEIQERGANEVWFNPGSDGPQVVARAEELGLEIIRACSIVDIGISPARL